MADSGISNYRRYERPPQWEAFVFGRTRHRLLIVHCLNSELEQTRKGLENVTGSYLQQLAGIEIVGDICLTELTDPGDGGK